MVILEEVTKVRIALSSGNNNIKPRPIPVTGHEQGYKLNASEVVTVRQHTLSY